ncbi:MAG: hypothetical protein WCC17_08495 [Candidatus Nitrosopolaris sp.]
MTSSTSSNIKGLPDSNPILKKGIRVADMMFVAIPESIVRELQIDEQVWFEEIPTSGGIFLKISRCSDSLALHKTGKEM